MTSAALLDVRELGSTSSSALRRFLLSATCPSRSAAGRLLRW